MKKLNNYFLRFFDIFKDKILGLYLYFIPDEKKFNFIYKYKYWKSSKSMSRSGYGSELVSTKELIHSLDNFIKKYNIKKVLDIPCGDFNWIKNIKLENLQYTGADIVPDLINENLKKYSKKNINFKLLDVIRDPLGDFDLIFNRDCLIHFNDHQIQKVLSNISKTKSKYFATTSYLSCKINKESNLPDNWRPLNLTISPFFLNNYIETIDDNFGNNELSKSKKILIYKLPLYD